MLEIENLWLTIDGKQILKGIDLHMGPGDTYGLLGPNGAGKSTTIAALLGLRDYWSDRVVVLGQDPSLGAAEIRRDLGVMPEHAGFYDWMTASGYLRWYARLYGVSPTPREIDMLLGRVGLGNVYSHSIGTFSRGMKQRLALARALLPHPRLLILDEPTDGLDPNGRREIYNLLAEFVGDGQTGVLLCTHLLDDVDRLCNRIGIIDQGRTCIEGLLDALMAEKKGKQRFRLRLEGEPDTASLPDSVTLLGHTGQWWRIQSTTRPSEEPSAIWCELWQRGWKIVEINAEASGVEEIYMDHVTRSRQRRQ